MNTAVNRRPMNTERTFAGQALTDTVPNGLSYSWRAPTQTTTQRLRPVRIERVMLGMTILFRWGAVSVRR